MRKILMFVMVSFILVVLAFPVFAANDKEAEGPIKIAYISKLLTHPWFRSEANGVKDKLNELGVEYLEADANLDSEAYMRAVDSMIAQGVDGIIHVITHIKLGPAVVAKCREAGVAIIAIDDALWASDDEEIPFVGFQSIPVGEMGGHALAKLAKERGFFAPGNIVKVMIPDMSVQKVVHDRGVGYMDALMQDIPQLKEDDFIFEDSKTCVMEDILPVASALLGAHPEATHWIGAGVNDDAAIAMLRVFEEAGFSLDNVIVSGLGGYALSYEEFQRPHNSFIVSKLDPYQHGYVAAQILYDFITKGTPMEDATIISGNVVTKENYQEFEWD